MLVSLIQNLPTIITTIVNAIPQIISSIVNALVGNIDKIIMAGVQLFVALIKNLPTIIVEIVKAVLADYKRYRIGIYKQYGQNHERLVATSSKAYGKVFSRLHLGFGIRCPGWISSIWDGICDFFGIRSPSREMGWIGEMLVKGLAGSIEDNGDEAVKAAEGMAADIDDVMHSLAEDMSLALPTNFSVDTSTVGGAMTNPDTSAVGIAGSLITVQQMIVRSEDDMSMRISQELYNLMQTSSRAQGQFSRYKEVRHGIYI